MKLWMQVSNTSKYASIYSNWQLVYQTNTKYYNVDKSI